MRIRRINLAAYGRFTDASIDFGPADKRVHLVYGPNEAGKSTLLRAIWRFFYGDLKSSPDDYQHSVANLRIDMTLEGVSGNVVRWTRRGGGAQSLRDEADQPVPLAQMQKVLCEISEEAFQQQFAINHDQLRRGSQELYQEKGELGAALFSAATGLSSVGRIASELEKEASDSFKPRATTLPINKAIKRIKELKDSLRKTMVSTAKYSEVLQLRNETAERVQALHSERTACQDRERKLQRIVAGIPKVIRLVELNAELQKLPPAPSLGPDFGARRQTAIAARERMIALIGENDRRLESLRAALSQLNPDPAAVELLPQLLNLEKSFGSYEKAQGDRARLAIEIAKSNRDVAEARRSLEGDQANAQAPPRHDLQHLRARFDGYKALSANVRTLQREVASIESQLARFDENASGSNELADIQPLKSAIDEAQLRSSIDQELDRLRLQIAQLTQSTQAELQSLSITPQADEFVSVELPLAAKIAEFDRRWSRIDNQLEEAQRRVKELSDTRDDLSHRLAAILSQGQAPTEDEVVRARAGRDEIWRDVRAFVAAPAVSPSQTPLLKKLDESLADRFESAMREADRLADLLRKEAHRIAERLKLESDQAVASAKLEAAKGGLSKVESDRDAFLAEWRAFASQAPTTMRTPPELKEWQPSALRLQDQVRKLGNLKTEINQLEDTRARLVRPITDAAAILSIPLTGESLGAILPAAQEHLRRMESEQSRRLAAADQVTQLRTRVTESRVELQTAQLEAEAAWNELKSSTKKWQWGAIENAAELDRLVPLMEDLERLSAEIREKTHRVNGIDRDTFELQNQVQAIAEKLRLSTSAGAIESSLAAISARLQETRRQLEQSQNLQSEILKQESTLVQQREGLALVESDLKALLLEAGADSLDALPHIELAAKQRDAIEAEKKSIKTQLDALTEDQTREAFAAACRQTDMSTARSEIADLETRVAELEGQIELQRQELRTHEAWLRDNRTLEKVATEEQSLQETLSELSTLMREHVKTRLAAEVLHRAMQRYRDENQGELLRAGGEIFSRLTSGGYSGIRTEISNRGAAELFAVRGQEPPVPLSCLSDGARDQLYLALRIATLEQHFRHHPPTPFVVDDIFVMFDEGRTLAALREFARLAESTQVIIFSHHAHVLELALSGLGERCVTHELTQTGPFRTSAQIHEAHPSVVPPTSTTRKRAKKEVAGGS